LPRLRKYQSIITNELNKLTSSPSPCPLPSREGRFMKSPLLLWERVRACPERSEGVRGM